MQKRPHARYLINGVYAPHTPLYQIRRRLGVEYIQIHNNSQHFHDTSENVNKAAKNIKLPLIFGAHKSFVRLRITPLLKLERSVYSVRILYLVNENIQSIDIHLFHASGR